MWWLELLILGLGVGAVGAIAAWSTGKRVFRALRLARPPFREPVRRIQGGPTRVFVDVTTDLQTYPNRLAGLETRLLQRHTEVQQQMQQLDGRRAEMADKDDRADLEKRYAEDLATLRKRADSLRRVAAVVWRTRAMLLYRVHLAGTARLRPQLGALPSGAEARRDLAGASIAYRAAAQEVRFYLDTIDKRLRELERLQPPEPLSAEVDDVLRADVARERAACETEHLSLRGRMDRLVDDLTWVADHFAAMKVMEGEEEVKVGAGADRILDEATRALTGIDKLSAAVDPRVADAAMDSLAADVSRLEQAGLDARAEADARLEVERLVGGLAT